MPWPQFVNPNRMTWLRPETLIYIRETTQGLELTTRDWVQILEAHAFLLAHLTVNRFNICATSNIDLVISTLHKIYSMLQSIFIHIKKPFFC